MLEVMKYFTITDPRSYKNEDNGCSLGEEMSFFVLNTHKYLTFIQKEGETYGKN